MGVNKDEEAIRKHAECLVHLTLGNCAMDGCYVAKEVRQQMVERTVQDLKRKYYGIGEKA